MKRFLAFILAIIMAFSFASCGKPNIEDCVKSADSVVPKTTPLAGNDYKFSTQYIPEENTYAILMHINEDALTEVYHKFREMAGDDDNYYNALVESYLGELDRKAEYIEVSIMAIKKTTETLFQDADITIAIGYLDRNGNITRYY